MITLGILNSRIKDFYDIWLLSRQFDFDGSQLTKAIQLTLEQRRTSILGKIVAFERPFAVEKQVQWAAFYKRLKQEHIPSAFIEIVTQVKCFLEPAVDAAHHNKPFRKCWTAASGWR